MKTVCALSLASLGLTLVSCSTLPEAEKNSPLSYEYTPKGDTVNMKDKNGRQGIWVPTLLNKLKDTTYYRNDTIINK